MRTALALLAAGVALEAFNVPIDPGYRLAASITLMTLAIVLPISAWIGWMRVERALRRNDPLPASHLGLVLAAGIMTASALLLIGLVIT
jgi:putative membrane protein